MGLKLLLVKDKQVLCEIPLSPDDWVKNELEEELENFREGLQKYTKILAAIMNENRVQMLCHLLEDEDLTLSFTDFREELRLNPKIIRENTMKLQEAGFLESPKRGKYKLSERGQVSFMMTGLALKRILKMLWEEY